MIRAALALFGVAVVLTNVAVVASPARWLGWLHAAGIIGALSAWMLLAGLLERAVGRPLAKLVPGALGVLVLALHAWFGAAPAGLPLEGPLDPPALAWTLFALAGGLLGLVQAQRLLWTPGRAPQVAGALLLLAALAALSESAHAAGLPWPGWVGLGLVAAAAATLLLLRRG